MSSEAGPLTRADLREELALTRADFREELALTRAGLREELAIFRDEIRTHYATKADLEAALHRQTKWLAGLVLAAAAAAVGVVIAVDRLFT